MIRDRRNVRPRALAILATLLALAGLLALPLASLGDSAEGRVVVPMLAADGLPPSPTPTPTPTPSPAPTGPAIYLTFDDGPSPAWTPAILQVLARYDAKATFFVVGSIVDAYPGLVGTTASGGHAVGLHSYNHVDLTRLSREQIQAEFLLAQDAIRAATGRWSQCVRPPYGSISATVREVAASLGLAVWLWTVDPRDWSRPGASVIVSRVLGAAGPGSVVLFHDGGGDRSQTLQALATLLAEYTRRGYRFLPLPC